MTIPIFGWGLWLANFVLLKRNWVDDQGKLKEAFLNITKYRTPVWIVSVRGWFPLFFPLLSTCYSCLRLAEYSNRNLLGPFPLPRCTRLTPRKQAE
ncbi:MAG: hypothetical protein BJ554DRAFT_5164, partial [Olpidium bornovanus]